MSYIYYNARKCELLRRYYMPFYRIDEYRIHPHGKRGSAIAIPNSVLNDLGVKPGEKLSIYRGVIGGLQVAVIANVDTPELATIDGLLDREPAAMQEPPKRTA
jgi:hypothetical protein